MNCLLRIAAWCNPIFQFYVFTELISHQSSTKHQGIITVSLLQPGVNQSQPDPSTFFNTSKPDPPGLQSLGKNILLEDDVDGLEESLLAGVQFGGNPDDPLDEPGLSMADLVALPSSKPSLSRCLLCDSPFEPGEKDHVCPVLLYNCDSCPEVLRSKIAYRTHLNKVHNLSESRIYECDQCTRIFTAQSSLHYHRDSTHSTLTYKCEEDGCSKVVQNLKGLSPVFKAVMDFQLYNLYLGNPALPYKLSFPLKSRFTKNYHAKLRTFSWFHWVSQPKF